MKDPSLEVFSFEAELRAAVDEATGEPTITGYAAVWDSISSVPMKAPDGRPYFERIARGAFSEFLLDPTVACFWDHKTDKILGRVGAGTLDRAEDDHGLRFTCRPPRTSYAADLLQSIERRDVWGCSLGFFKRADEWTRDANDRLIRTITKARLFEVSPVSIPAYRETGVALRSLAAWESREQAAEVADPGTLALTRARLRLAELGRN